MSSHKKLIEEVKFAGVHGVRKYPKIKIDHQMDNVIFLDSALQVNVLKQKDGAEKISRKASIALNLVATGNHAASNYVKSPTSTAITFSTKIL